MTVLSVLYVVALATGTGCGAFLRVARLRHEDPEATP